ncbi:MAG: DNA polymerase IV [Lachnospiraceae bacterium]|nr:DNA polymerase IV [Lachnospiraceae bacterium]
MDRVILHSDCNCFYASVEMLHRPGLWDVPMAVGGDPEARHGIVLTANYIAKRRGVKTGMALWQARQACPDITFVPPRMDLYIKFSRMIRRIYSEYTDLVEPFGLDEAWLDVTASAGIRGDGRRIAEELRERIRREIGITVSVGVSWNKIYAKLGSDYKKPDAVTEFSRENYRNAVYPIPVGDLLYVGRATSRKLYSLGITTVGELAAADPGMLRSIFGKIGLMLSVFARGLDETPVSPENTRAPIKSIGNSTTTPRDLTTEEDVDLVLYLLSESVASRCRDNGFIGQVVEISVRDCELHICGRQKKLGTPTNISEEIHAAAISLFHEIYRWERPIRSIGVRIGDLKPDTFPYQLDLFHDEAYRQRLLKADLAVDDIRRRFGFSAVQRGIMYRDRYLSSLNAKADDHMVHPHSYLERGNRTGCEKIQKESAP